MSADFHTVTHLFILLPYHSFPSKTSVHAFFLRSGDVQVARESDTCEEYRKHEEVVQIYALLMSASLIEAICGVYEKNSTENTDFNA